MAVRIARGLFRLWLVLSVLWIGAVVAVTWFDLTHPNILTDTEVGIPGMFDDLIIEARNIKAVKFGVGLALAPPVLVLVIGWALSWAFRGFRT